METTHTTQTTDTPSLGQILGAARILGDTSIWADDPDPGDRIGACRTLVLAGWPLGRSAHVLGLCVTGGVAHCGTVRVSDEHWSEHLPVPEDCDSLTSLVQALAERAAADSVGSGCYDPDDQHAVTWEYTATIDACDADGSISEIRRCGSALDLTGVETPPCEGVAPEGADAWTSRTGGWSEIDDGDHDWTDGGDEFGGVRGLGGTCHSWCHICRCCGAIRRITDPGSQANPGEGLTVEYG